MAVSSIVALLMELALMHSFLSLTLQNFVSSKCLSFPMFKHQVRLLLNLLAAFLLEQMIAPLQVLWMLQ